ncbi:MAG: efflux RND transporter periplasmic adaptor subunit [bacterium]|nr:efflux RND transporter periplasmic adaptor subunit [bacterium]
MKGWSMTAMAALAGLLLACGAEEGAKGAVAGRGPQGAAGGRAEAALPVKTETVTRGEITRYVETHARLEAERWVEVVSRAQGLVQRLAAEEGDRVQAGAILVQLEKEELQLQVEQAKVALDQATSAFARTKTLYDRQLVSQEEFERARNLHENAAVALREGQLRLSYADIRAPLGGVVMRRSVERGDLVRSNDVVFVVADLEPLQARIRVPEKRMSQVRPGQAARITVDSAPGRVFAAMVRMISPGVDPASGTVKVTLDVDPDDALRPGMFATVRIVTDRQSDALIVPKKALVLETDEDDVFAVRDGKAERVRVELGYTDGDRVQILAGLDEGDQVITVGHEGLKDNAAVRLVGAEAPVVAAAEDGSGSHGGGE